MNVGLPTSAQLDAELSLGIGHVAMFSMFQHRPSAEHARTVNAVQRYLVEETRLGIPAILRLEALNGLIAPDTTVSPTAIALASTWNVAGVEEMASKSQAGPSAGLRTGPVPRHGRRQRRKMGSRARHTVKIRTSCRSSP